MRSLARYAWGVLAYNILVILWGAFVRATGSGAGCGSHWPTCNGEVVPRATSTATLIELTHRVTSGLALVLIIGLVVAAFRVRPAGDPARRLAVWSLVFVLLEAAIGAGLVLFEWVAGDTSLARGLVMGAHLVNTFLLLGALTLTAWSAAGGRALGWPSGRVGALLVAGTLGMFLSGASGGIAALGDTIFPARTLAEGLAQDLATTSHVFLKLRVLHPVFTVATSALLVAAALLARRRGPAPARRAAGALVGLVVAQVGVGVLDVLLLAPIPLQLVHLALADAVWVALVLLVVTAAAPDTRRAAEVAAAPGPARASSAA